MLDFYRHFSNKKDKNKKAEIATRKCSWRTTVTKPKEKKNNGKKYNDLAQAKKVIKYYIKLLSQLNYIYRLFHFDLISVSFLNLADMSLQHGVNIEKKFDGLNA